MKNLKKTENNLILNQKIFLNFIEKYYFLHSRSRNQII